MPLTVLPKVLMYNFSLYGSEDTMRAYQQQVRHYREKTLKP
jgi:hypothetical protein